MVRSVKWGDGSKFFATAADPFTSRDLGTISIFEFPTEEQLQEGIYAHFYTLNFIAAIVIIHVCCFDLFSSVPAPGYINLQAQFPTQRRTTPLLCTPPTKLYQ